MNRIGDKGRLWQNPTPTLRKIPGDRSRSAQSYSFPSHSHANLSKAFRVIVLTVKLQQSLRNRVSNRPAANKAKGRIQRFAKLSAKAPLKPLRLMGLMLIVNFSVSWLLRSLKTWEHKARDFLHSWIWISLWYFMELRLKRLLSQQHVPGPGWTPDVHHSGRGKWWWSTDTLPLTSNDRVN